MISLAAGLSSPVASAQDEPAANPGDAALPAGIAPGSPLAQVIQLVQSEVDESVILAYISNSASAFNLTADQIIYLKDLGLPADAMTAMIQHDQQLGATATAAPVPPPQPAGQTATSAQPAAVTQNYFYDTLSPYGKWVNVEGSGLCWQPTVVVYDSSWQPYSDHGHWVYTDDGWYWLSDYSWGATAFHYGRWFHDPHHGWCWWPDTTWAPSWVTWRYADDYCGWAPLPPHTVYREGAGIYYNGAVVSAGFDFGLDVSFFTFVPTKNFNDPHPHRYRLASAQVRQIYGRTTVINNFNADSRSHAIINAGIPPQRITAVTRAEIRPVTIREMSSPVSRGEQVERNGQTLDVNRPHFDTSDAAAFNSVVRPSAQPHVAPAATRQEMNQATMVRQNAVATSVHNQSPPQYNYSQANRTPNVLPSPAPNNFQHSSAGYKTQMGAPVQDTTVTPPQVQQNRPAGTDASRPANQNPQWSHNPQVGAPVQTVAPSQNYERGGNFNSPKNQEQPPHFTAREPAAVAPAQQPQPGSPPRPEERPANQPPATQNVPAHGQPASAPAQPGQQKSGRDKDLNSP